MFISSGISILILSLALDSSNALQLTLDKVEAVCRAERLVQSLMRNMTSNGSIIFNSIHIAFNAEKLTTIGQRFCLNRNSSFNRLRESLTVDVLNSISYIAGCKNRSESILIPNCARFQGADHLIRSLSSKPKVQTDATQIIHDLVALDVTLFDSMITPKLDSLSITLADQNQATVKGIVENYKKILDAYRSLL